MGRVYRRGVGADTARLKGGVFRRSPCRRPPSQPTNLSSGFDRAEGGRGQNRIRLWGRWDEVTTDTSGFSIRPRTYKVHAEYSANTTNAGSVTPGTEDGDWYVAFRLNIPGKEDADPNSMVRFVRKGIRGKLAYRWYVVAIDVDGCRSARAWATPGRPNDETPPAPSNVRIFPGATDRVVVDWDDTADPDDADRRRDDQSWFIVHWSTSATFATIYARDRKTHKTRAALKVPDADRGQTFYARVLSVNDAGDKNYKSLPIPATLAGNSDPGATPDGVTIGAGGGGFVVRTFHKPGRLRVRHYPGRITNVTGVALKFKRARAVVGNHDAATHPNDDCPTGSAVRIQLVLWSADESTQTNLFDSDDRLKIDAGTHKDVNPASSFNVSQWQPDEHISLNVRSVGSSFPGANLVVDLFMEP